MMSCSPSKDGIAVFTSIMIWELFSPQPRGVLVSIHIEHHIRKKACFSDAPRTKRTKRTLSAI